MSGEGPAASRASPLRTHGAFLALFAVAAPLTLAFCWQSVVATLGDDSVSYLALARLFSPFSSDPFSAPWVKYHAHFAPLFPLLLAFTGGAGSLLAAHLAVGTCALLALPLLYRYAALRLGGTAAGVLATLLVLLTPGAWAHVSGILSESLFLALSLAALAFHERRIVGAAGKAAFFTFGVLLAAVFLTRVAGIALIAAYAIRVVVHAIARRKLPAPSAAIPFIAPLALALVWRALRPEPDMDNYRLTLGLVLDRWLADPAIVQASLDSLVGGWVGLFAGDSEVSLAMRLAFGAIGVLGIAGALLGARKNRLDAWYVLASLTMLFVWVFPEPIARRLLYPLLPLLLIQAAEALAALCASLKAARQGRRVMLAAWALAALLVLPASLLTLQKALERAPLFPDSRYSYSSITDYYTTVNVARARVIAGEHAAVLAGLESIGRATAPEARVMWMRPEYVAVLGKRASTAWYLSWDRARLAHEILRTGTTHMVFARLYKNDLAGRSGDAFTSWVAAPPAYLRPTLIIANPADGTMAFVLVEVDRDGLARYMVKDALPDDTAAGVKP